MASHDDQPGRQVIERIMLTSVTLYFPAYDSESLNLPAVYVAYKTMVKQIISTPSVTPTFMQVSKMW